FPTAAKPLSLFPASIRLHSGNNYNQQKNEFLLPQYLIAKAHPPNFPYDTTNQSALIEIVYSKDAIQPHGENDLQLLPADLIEHNILLMPTYIPIYAYQSYKRN